MGKSPRVHDDSSWGYSYAHRKRRSKIDWAGLNIGDAFKPQLDYYVRIPAQRVFYRVLKKAQIVAAGLAHAATDQAVELKVKPQLSPCYTSYPAVLSAFSAIGITAFMEFRAQAKQNILMVYIQEYLQNPAVRDGVGVEPELYRGVAHTVAETVQTRLLLHELAGHASLFPIESYRIFCAAHHTGFRSLQDILNAVILYGDLLPDWRYFSPHPTTADLLAAVARESRPYSGKLSDTAPQNVINLGIEWVRAVCLCLADFLPEVGSEPNGQLERVFDQIPPLDQPQEPSLFNHADRQQQLLQSFFRPDMPAGFAFPEALEDHLDEEVLHKWQAFAHSITQAGGQQREWEDLRYDLLEIMLRSNPFAEGPIQGNPADGHEVSVKLGDNCIEFGELFDRPVELSDNHFAYDCLMAEAKPIADEMRRVLYPNIEQVPWVERIRTTGQLDPNRLALAQAAEGVFKRHRMQERVDKSGSPVLVLACDGSASLNRSQLHMVKLLAAAWLNATQRTQIRVLAALYHSGLIRANISGPLVQWIYHPRTTPAIGRKDAARALVSLPENGTGAQSDALSIAFILDEAKQLARGRMIYLILISDCAWNRSFDTSKAGKDEVLAFFETAYGELGSLLHTTLIGLGCKGETGFEGVVQKIICLTESQLNDPASVAGSIGAYVASCMKERTRMVAS